jgi:hypothetical protein
MPCYTVTTVQLKLKPEIVRMEWLEEVIRKLGYAVNRRDSLITWSTGYYDRQNGVLSERTEQAASRIRQSYAAELTRRTLGRAGWQVKTVEHGGK